MEKRQIKRVDFKKSMIDQVILRIDYEGSIINLPDIIKSLQPFLAEHEYSELVKGRIGQNQINVSVEDPDIDPKVDFLSENRENFFFFKENRRFQIQVNEGYLVLVANLNSELISFDEYSQLIIDVLDIIKETNNSYIDIKRIGLRKINTIYLKNNADYEKVFERTIFSSLEIENYEGEKKALNNLENYFGAKNNVNFRRVFDVGEDANTHEDVYRYILDIDSYMSKSYEQLSVPKEFTDNFKGWLEAVFTELNNVCFDFFISSCRIEFLMEMIK